MLKPKCKIIISRYNEDYSWINKYTDNYLIYNKGEEINDSHIINVENIGENQIDIFRFIYDNYESLPDIMIFIQAYPFDHCREDIFKELIKKDEFTVLEYQGDAPANGYEQRDVNGGYMEINNSWYITSHNNTYNQTCKYSSFDEFMNKYFSNYTHIDWIRFAPGSQYLVTKSQVLNYSRNFWKTLKDELYLFSMTEGHIIERALYYILNGDYSARF